ncbi:uncharacterized protein [Anoplolepis gracilipes]|uniref:uncharacterized protein n=1 Tax=Anoplolepis gracilipes TaxID=354296 RepID=UPI003B9EAEC0
MHFVIVILPLISIAYAGTMTPPNFKILNAQLTVNGTDSVQNNNSPTPIYPTYPEYKNMSTREISRVKEGSQDKPSPKNTAVVPKIFSWSYENIVSSLTPFFDSLILYGGHASKFVLQLSIALIVGITSVSLICTYTSICKTIFPEKLEIKDLAHKYITSENLDFLTSSITKAFDRFNFMQNDEDDAQQDSN